MEFVRSPRHWAKFLAKSGLVLHKCVGNGSFGDVFAVTMTTTGDAMAVKRLVARRKISKDVYAMAEIEALMELRHPNIVALEEVLLCARMVCLVMELAPWGNLQMFLTNSTSPSNQLLNHQNCQPGPAHTDQEKSCPVADDQFRFLCFEQVTSALQFCHCQHLAHRDINPSNVLIFNSSLVKLADFNLCFRCIDVTSDEPVLCEDYLGQDSYLAPEVKSHRPYHAMPADVWSLGCLLYFIINSKHVPQQESDNFLQRSSHTDSLTVLGNDEINNNVSSWTAQRVITSLIQKMCSPDPETRPNIDSVVQHWELLSHIMPNMSKEPA